MTTTQTPHLWTRRPQIITPTREPVGIRSGVQGWFKIEAGKRDGRRRLLADWFPNLITNSGLDSFGAQAGFSPGQWTEARVGSGTNSPSAGDTTLQATIARTGSATLQARSRSAQSDPPYYGSMLTTYRFAEGAAAGNLSEVGIGDDETDGVLLSRSRILDAENNPTTITVLADEFLDVTYELRLYPPEIDFESTIDLGGSDLVFDYIVRPVQVNQTAQWAIAQTDNTSGTSRIDGMFAVPNTNTNAHWARPEPLVADRITQPPNSSSGYTTSAFTDHAYTTGNYYRDTTLIWGLNNGNMGGIQSAYIQCGRSDQSSSSGAFGRFGLGFTPAIPKDETMILELNFRSRWARVTL